MSVSRRSDGTIVLDGRCPVEDAEPLLELLQATPAAPFDWSQCTYLHTAVLQVILAARPAPSAPCGDAWVRQWVEISESSVAHG
jgi:hypothetical protein